MPIRTTFLPLTVPHVFPSVNPGKDWFLVRRKDLDKQANNNILLAVSCWDKRKVRDPATLGMFLVAHKVIHVDLLHPVNWIELGTRFMEEHRYGIN